MSGPVLITGGAGSVGRILASRLRQEKRAVRVFDLPAMNYAGLEGGERGRLGRRGIRR